MLLALSREVSGLLCLVLQCCKVKKKIYINKIKAFFPLNFTPTLRSSVHLPGPCLLGLLT